MPHNLNALIRYRAINKCLINGKMASKYDLVEACRKAIGKKEKPQEEINRDNSFSTLNADIREMKDNGELGYMAPILFDHSEEKYYYSDRNYSIDNLPLSDDELESVLFAAKYLGQMKDVEIFREFSASAAKIAVFVMNLVQLLEKDMKALVKSVIYI
jgi:hypothetical protein